MKESLSLKEFKNKLPLEVKSKSTETNKISVAESIERIQSKNTNIPKIEEIDLHKKSYDEIKDFIKELTDHLTEMYYEMEISILNNGYIGFEDGVKVNATKAIISFCKILLCQPGINEITFPEEFIEEYTTLLKRTNEAIIAVSNRIERLKLVENNAPLLNTLEKNLLTLNMLRHHYITALELPEPDLE